MKKFLFLYPIPEIIDFEIKSNGWVFFRGGEESFRKEYMRALNSCIDLRYRQKDFGINYALFNDSSVSDIIEVRKSDRIIRVGLDFKTHTANKVYPNQDVTLNQILPTEKLVVAGFHMWDCVDKLARRAYERGIDVLVDEDLTEFLAGRFLEPWFKVGSYPSYNPKQMSESLRIQFMSAREKRPWLWQDY